MVVLEILSVLGTIEGQLSMRYELRVAPSQCSCLSICHSTGAFNGRFFIEGNGAFDVMLVFQLIHELNGDISSKWPLEVTVKLSPHQMDIHRDMGAGAALWIHTEAHLVPFGVRVEGRTEPSLTSGLQVIKSTHSEVDRENANMRPK